MKTLNLLIETARDRDYQQIFAIWLDHINHTFPGNFFDQRRLAAHFRENFITRNKLYPFYTTRDEDDEITGWLGVIRSCHNPLRENFCGEVSIYVRKDVRHEGIGTLLMQHAVEKARQTELQYLQAYTRVTNYAIRKLLLNCGWEEIGIPPLSLESSNNNMQRTLLMYAL
ncbi:MAG TPA: GNAT family N-acetyltransferase [Chitinophaga sp.]|uniref:GNAT family N-acetyltransferase n=1 Tax=Chitinophaga sp. TaxID=1869181 RepID=UPI002C8A4021|nr:GNAT family N-acetyltransferase [Chitinophaga sp.]HVI46650.1 GNAT family N-acetyltransferase [Chitinophaga sp.]